MGYVLAIGTVIVVFYAALMFVLSSMIFVCAPNEVLIFSGRRHMVDGQLLGYRVVKGGRALKIPMLESVQRLDISNCNIVLRVENVYTKGGLPLNVELTANVRINANEPFLRHAIERFLGQPRSHLHDVMKQLLEGHTRALLATVTAEELHAERRRMADMILTEAREDMNRLGLLLDTFAFVKVLDDSVAFEAPTHSAETG